MKRRSVTSVIDVYPPAIARARTRARICVRARSGYYRNDMFREFIRRDTFATISNRNECNVTVMMGGLLERARLSVCACMRVREEVDKIRERNDVRLACRAYFLKTATPAYRPTRS